MYKHNSKYGLIWKEDKQQFVNDLLVNDKLKEYFFNFRHDMKIKIAQMDPEYKKFIFINIHPVGCTCEGSCPYCYQAYLNINDKLNIQYLNLDVYEKYIQKIQAYMIDEPELRIGGGSFLLYPYLDDMINITLKYFKKINLFFHVDFTCNEFLYNMFLQNIKNFIKNKQIKQINLYISVDFGSDTRHSLYNNITSLDIKQRAKQQLDLFENEEKIKIIYKTNINKNTDIESFIKECKEMIDRKCYIMYNPVRHKLYTPSIQYFKKVIGEIEKTFGNSIPIYVKEMILNSDYVQHNLKNDEFKISLFELDAYVYLLDYVEVDCRSAIHTIGISTTGYSTCPAGLLNTSDENNMLKITNTIPYYNEFITPYPDCLKCNLYGICNACNIKKYIVMGCDSVFKYWQYYMWIQKINNTQSWFIKK